MTLFKQVTCKSVESNHHPRIGTNVDNQGKYKSYADNNALPLHSGSKDPKMKYNIMLKIKSKYT